MLWGVIEPSQYRNCLSDTYTIALSYRLSLRPTFFDQKIIIEIVVLFKVQYGV